MKVTPETLTDDVVRGVQMETSAFANGTELLRACETWLRWDRAGRDHNEFNARKAARVICDAINARADHPA